MKKSLTIAAAPLSTDVTPAKPDEVAAHLLKPGVKAGRPTEAGQP